MFVDAVKFLISGHLHVFLLPEIISEAIPRLPMNRSKLLAKASLDMFGTKSNCTALLLAHACKDM